MYVRIIRRGDMAQARRTSSRNSLTEKNTNRSDSSLSAGKSISSTEVAKQENRKQNSSSSLKILGQDGEVSEDVALNGTVWDRSTPVSRCSQQSSRPGSSSGRTPTPSKQISLQAVKRKQESTELLEPINWNDIDKPLKVEERPSKLLISDRDSDTASKPATLLSTVDQLALVEERTKQLTSALSTVHLDDTEADLSRRLERIETAREERERRKKEHEKLKEHTLTVEDGQFTYRNEHFRDLSRRDEKDKIDSNFILDGRDGAYFNESVTVGPKPPAKRRGENVIGKHPMDKQQETVISAESKQMKQNESEKEEEASGDVKSSSEEDSDEDEEEDLIGEKGRAPNALLMEFLSSMMEEEYETAEKLCRMILIYEPENPEALSFYPLIQEKIKQEEEGDDDDDSDVESEDSGEEEESEDENEEEDDDDDNDDESESSEGSEDENVAGSHPDSGIASANSD